MGVGIAAYDVIACRTGGETLSTGYGRALACRPALTLTLTGYLVLHLAGPLLPPWCGRFDLLSLAADRLRALPRRLS